MATAQKERKTKTPPPGREGTKRALITGASSGIGEAFVRELARKGYDVVLVARRRDRMEKLAANVTALNGVVAEIIEADLACPKPWRRRGASEARRHLDRRQLRRFRHAVSSPACRKTANWRRSTLTSRPDPPEPRGAGDDGAAHSGTIINVASTGAFQPSLHGDVRRDEGIRALLLGGAARRSEAHGVTVTCVCPGPPGRSSSRCGVNERASLGLSSPETVATDSARASGAWSFPAA
jgi:NAD(P)-dependent dehydrogenase (short-subunit alcohol dehydrogenase family)